MYYLRMNIVLDDKLVAGEVFSEKQLLLDLAIGLYVDRKTTLGRSAAIAGLSECEFMKLLGSLSVPIHYDIDDVASDIRVIAGLAS